MSNKFRYRLQLRSEKWECCEVEFTDTPLHIAEEQGCIRFAMEMINLKPAYARKLNQQGLSHIHLAVEKRHKEMVLRLLEIDNDVVRVKGKNGETPLHYIHEDL
ncbi:hypothetical protein V6N12_008153 [Hibiscus sabdariffa]|uniref:Uncharacterized protein n=1 Tax=Hibiscus sabdariffa TaxID=183260 RepID=A0ABR2BUH6_9ROSI